MVVRRVRRSLLETRQIDRQGAALDENEGFDVGRESGISASRLDLRNEVKDLLEVAGKVDAPAQKASERTHQGVELPGIPCAFLCFQGSSFGDVHCREASESERGGALAQYFIEG